MPLKNNRGSLGWLVGNIPAKETIVGGYGNLIRMQAVGFFSEL